MKEFREVIGISNGNTETLIDPMFIINADLSASELKLLIFILELQTKRNERWIEIDNKEIAQNFNISEVSLARWFKKLESNNLLEKRSPRGLSWRVSRKILNTVTIPIFVEVLKKISIDELKEELYRLNNQSIYMHVRGAVAFQFPLKLKFTEEIVDGENNFVIANQNDSRHVFSFLEKIIVDSTKVTDDDWQIIIKLNNDMSFIFSDYEIVT